MPVSDRWPGRRQQRELLLPRYSASVRRGFVANYQALILFELPDGEGIDAGTAAVMLGNRLYEEPEQFKITALSVERI